MKWDKAELVMWFIQINGGKERGGVCVTILGKLTWFESSDWTDIFSCVRNLSNFFFNEGIDKENKNTHIIILTVKVAPSVMMGWDGIKTDWT